MTTARAQITMDAWEHAAQQSTYAAAIHPSGASGVEGPAWNLSGCEHAGDWTAGYWHHTDPDVLERPAHLLARHDQAEPPETILDFGAGAGRVSFPLAALWPTSEVIAADSSPTMLRRLAETHHRLVVDLPNVHPLVSDGFDGRLPKVDAIHSIIVLQHHLWQDGEELLRRLVLALHPGGVAGVQLPLYDQEGQSTDWTGVTTWTRHRFWRTVRNAGAEVLEDHVSPGAFRPGAPGEHHGAYHWLRRAG